MKPGIIDVTRSEHHAIRALSFSGMKALSISPLRYWYENINPAPKPEEEESAALRKGSALHCAVLESEETFESRYARALDASDWPVCLDTVGEIRDWVKSKGGECKGIRKEDVISSAVAHMKKIGESVPILQLEQTRFAAANEGKTILNPDEWTEVAGMAQALAEEPALKPILSKGTAEQSMIARDPETGVWLKARLDWVAPKITLDLKSFSVKRESSVDKSICDAMFYEKYNVQAVFYDFVRTLALNEEPLRNDFVFAFVESEQPHETRIRRLVPKRGGTPNLYWEFARQEIRNQIRKYAECLKRWGDAPWRETQEIETLADEDIRQLAYAA